MQPPGEQRQIIAIPELGSRTKALVERPADNPIMVEQPDRFVSDELFKLVFGSAGARRVARAGFGGYVVRPMPAQRMIVDLKLPSGSLRPTLLVQDEP